jgi:hypothetical protein
VTSNPNGGSSTSTTKQGTGWNGNEVTKKDTYKQGPAGGSETHAKTETDQLAVAPQPTQPLPASRNNTCACR